MKMSTPLIVSNFLLFQIGWFACVGSAAAHQPWIGPLVTMGVVVVHVLRASTPQAELTLVALALAIGLVFDSFLVWQGWLQYSSGMALPNVAPYWIVALWGLFATLLNVSLRWMRGRWGDGGPVGRHRGPCGLFGWPPPWGIGVRQPSCGAGGAGHRLGGADAATARVVYSV